MGKKVFWFDVETTGLNPVDHDIVQLALLIEIDDEIVESKNMLMQPFDYSTIDLEALNKQGRTVEEIKTYPNPKKVYPELISVLEKYVDRYDKTDKFHNGGYNSKFDMDFLKQYFIKNGDIYFGSWFNYRSIDPLPLLHLLDGIGHISLPDYKLETVCKHYKIPLKAHDALSDITATRELTKHICSNYIATKGIKTK